MRSLILCVLALSMCIQAGFAQVAKRFDIVIDELFPDPSPTVGLPNSEFIELKNNSGHSINLKNWKISDGSSTATINTNFLLGVDSFLILCSTSALSSFTQYGSAIGVSGFPSLNNDADQMMLFSPEGIIIHAVQYDVSWYRNDLKKEGGWSIEMIDTRNPCNGSNNWVASTDKSGGSPGRKNSVDANNPDLIPPALVRSYAIDSSSIVLVFDESLDSLSASLASSYSINGKAPGKVVPLSPFFKEVKLGLNESLSLKKIYPINVNAVKDCAGNSIGMMNSARVALPEPIANNEILINEILFNPLPEGVDYAEIYNNSQKTGDLSKLHLANRNTSGNLINMVALSSSPYLIFPGDYLVFTENRIQVQRQYAVPSPQWLMELPSMPSLPDDKGQLVLLNEQGAVVDEVSYDQQWHFSLLGSKEGVALERMDFSKASNDRTNWTSAASTVGYGTPTYRNSQYLMPQQTRGSISVTPTMFSPNNDGFDDFAIISYAFNQNNLVGNLNVYDLNGKIIRGLGNQLTLSQTGNFRWDGMDDLQQAVPSGIYILLFEIFGLDGRTEKYKKMVSLVRRSK